MSHASLHRILTEKQRDIFSVIPAATASLPQLRALQEAVFSSLLLMLGNGGNMSPEVRLGAAADNAAAVHSLAEQITALNLLERVVLESSRNDNPAENLTGALYRTLQERSQSFPKELSSQRRIRSAKSSGASAQLRTAES